MRLRKLISGTRGFTVLEVLIAALLTGILTAASFSFYVRLHAQSEAQFELADTQNLCRVCLCDIKKNLRVAGYKVPAGHPAFEINGDTLAIYRNGSQPVDTIKYYLVEYTTAEYNQFPNRDMSVTLSKLMKQTNSGAPQLYADLITTMRVVPISATSIEITIAAQTRRADASRDMASEGAGFEQVTAMEYAIFELDETVTVRNGG